jgi:hypothetical protein
VALSATLLAVVAATAALAAPPPAPFPAQRAGSGDESTAGGGLFAGAPYRARSAVIRWNGRIESLDLYLFRKRVTSCAAFEHAVTEPGRVIQIGAARGAVRLPVGSPVRRPLAQFVTQRREPPPQIVFARPVELVFTRVDTARGGTWHGRVAVKPRRVEGRRYSYAGTFAARWCVAP